MRGYNRYLKDHLKDELQSIKGLGPVLFDVNRFIRMDELSLPARVNEYTFREILEVVEKLKAGELDEEVTINENGIYLAAKRLRRLKISFKIVPSNPINQNGFSIINNFN
jgi:hypothetical protein